MTTETIKTEIVTVADLIAVLEKIEDKNSKVTICGQAGGCYSCTAENIDRQIDFIEVSCWDQFHGTVELYF